MKTISDIVNLNICTSCGACLANCPIDAIRFRLSGYMYLPYIDNEKCVNCGKCLKVCPNVQNIIHLNDDYIDGFFTRNIKEVFGAKTRNIEILQNAVSGGIVTALIYYLLKDHYYDNAFCVKQHCYERLVETEQIHNYDNLFDTQKSRYITISQQKAIEYIIRNPSQKTILVGTGCAVEAFINTIRENGLDRNNYFIIGLFCDRTMTYGVIDYFQHHPKSIGKIKEFYFRTKESSGWPGDIKIVYDNGKTLELLRTERMEVKDYFTPEGCLYCINKLNVSADISVGDNYIKGNEKKEGFSSVILRSERAQYFWRYYNDKFDYKTDLIENLFRSQNLNDKKINNQYRLLKENIKTNKVSRKVKKSYKRALKKIAIGNNGKLDLYNRIQNNIKVERKIYKTKRIIYRFIHCICRLSRGTGR